jgi:hypothetical protein
MRFTNEMIRIEDKKFLEFTQKKTSMTVPMHRKLLKCSKREGMFPLFDFRPKYTSKMFAKLLSLLKWFGEHIKNVTKEWKVPKRSLEVTM